MGFIYWLVFGSILGIIAALVDSHRSDGGVVGRILLSVTGVLLALFLANLIYSIPSSFSITTLMIAAYGAVIFLLTGRSLRRL
jgi:uncharacterized membrane protein YeaQ/YmgE (transglycosylase-associated protein family)